MEYISKERLYDELTEILTDEGADVFMKRVPFIDIVRCEECKHHSDEYMHFCRRLGIELPDDAEFFCSYGERRTE